MRLTLTVERSSDPDVEGQSITFDSDGGTLGRGPDNDWVMSNEEKEISRRHAVIRLDGGRFVLEDLSTNGTFHNSRDHLIGKSRTVALEPGDLILLGNYELRVSVAEPDPGAARAGQLSPTAQDSLLDGLESEGPVDPEPVERDEFDDILDAADHGPADHAGAGGTDSRLPFASDESSSELPGLDLDDDEDAARRRGDTDPVTDEYQQSPEREYFQAPGTARDPADEIPDEWDALLTGFFEPAGSGQDESAPESDSRPDQQTPSAEQERPARQAPPVGQAPPAGQAPQKATQPDSPEPAATPPRPSASPSQAASRRSVSRPSAPAGRALGNADSVVLERIFSELGIRDSAAEVDAEDFAEQIGKVVRMVGEGLMQLLASRAEIKNEFRIDQTRIASTQNNPLKFSPTIEEAMRRVFVERNIEGFISGAESFEQALNDLRAHQVAILAAVQGAIESVIRQFDPEQLEAKLKKISPISASAPLIREAKCWNLFTSHYEDMAANLRHDAKRVFVREFAEAYEQSSREIARQIAESRGKGK